MHNQLSCGRQSRVLNAVNDVTKECLAAFPMCYGTEFTSNAVLAWTQERKLNSHYIAPGKPTQNAFCEAYNAFATNA